MSLSFLLTVLTVKIPEDILLEILARLPADSVTRFKCVSKLWYSLISSRYFTDLFFKCSAKRERRVFVCDVDDFMLFHSSFSNFEATTSFSQLNHGLNLFTKKKNHDLNLPGIGEYLEFVNVIRGLMCFRVERHPKERDTQIRIINFTTGQILNLPLLESNILLESDAISRWKWNYFGYDPVNYKYKVLSIISSTNKTNEWISETRVFVLGDGASWRNTRSLTSPPPDHCPYDATGGIFIDGVLYYGAWSNEDITEDITVLMSFDFNSEEFNLIEIPAFFDFYEDDLMNYQDQIAVLDVFRLKTDCILDLWMLEDARMSKWSHKVFVLPFHQLRVDLDIDDLQIKGTGSSGDVTLSEKQVNRNKKSNQAIYNLERNRITRGFFMETPYPKFGILQTVICDDVESIVHLEA